MKRFILILVICFLTLSVSNQEEKRWYLKLDESGFITKYGEEMSLPNGAEIVMEFVNGYAAIRVITKPIDEYENIWSCFSIINTKGIEIFKYSDVGSNRLLGNFEGLFAAERDKRWGYVDIKGNWVIQPRFKRAGIFEEGYAYVWIGDDYVCINKRGEIISYMHDKIYSYGKFYNEIAWFGNTAAFNFPKLGYIDINGKEIAPEIYKEAEDFSEGKAAVSTGSKGPWFFLDTKGEKVESIPEAKYYSSFNEGLAIAQPKGQRKVGFINHKGEMVIPAIYDYVTPFVDGYAGVAIDEPRRKDSYHEILSGKGFYGIIDKEGNMVLEIQYDGIPVILPGGAAKVLIREDKDTLYGALIDIENGGKVFDKGENVAALNWMF